MNNKRRTAIEAIKEQLEALFNQVEELATEEREAFEAMPEGLQQSARGQASEDAAYTLENATCELQTVIDSLEEAAT